MSENKKGLIWSICFVTGMAILVVGEGAWLLYMLLRYCNGEV